MASAINVDQRNHFSFRLNELVVDCSEPESLARFWATVLGYDVCESEPMMAAVEDPAGVGPSICFQRVPEEKRIKNRLHFDLDVDEGTLEIAVSRLVEFGARRVDLGQGDQRSWAVLADPEGNEFCVVA